MCILLLCVLTPQVEVLMLHLAPVYVGTAVIFRGISAPASSWGTFTSIKMWPKSGEQKHTADLIHVAFHIHDSVRNDSVGKPCL